MDGLLNPIQTVKRIQEDIDKFDTLTLAEQVKTQSAGEKSKRSVLDITPTADGHDTNVPLDSEPLVTLVTIPSSETSSRQHIEQQSSAFPNEAYLNRPLSVTSDNVREILSSQPSSNDLLSVLRYLKDGVDEKHDFNLHILGSKQSQIINILVQVAVLDQWHNLRQPQLSGQDKLLRRLLVSCLRCVAGISAILMQINNAIQDTAPPSKPMKDDAISLLSVILQESDTLLGFLFESCRIYPKETQLHLAWQEVVALLAGSRVLSIIARATSTVDGGNRNDSQWLGEATSYCRWLARNISVAAAKINITYSIAWNMLAQITKRALSLGYRDVVVSEIYTSLILVGEEVLWLPLQNLLSSIPAYEQKVFFDNALRNLAQTFLPADPLHSIGHKDSSQAKTAIGGVAATLQGMTESSVALRDHLIECLTSTSGSYVGISLGTRRAIVATLAQNELRLQTVLDKCFASFGDKIQINHSPILQQEITTQTILLSVAYLNRLNHEQIKTLSKSSIFLQSVSNRLAASVPRARYLGILVGTAISKLVDTPENVMSFDIKEMENAETQQWLDLIYTNDAVLNVESLRSLQQQPAESFPASTELNPHIPKNRVKKNRQPAASKIISIEEIEDGMDEDEDEDGLIPYAKPDSDPSDSEDDPTLINRNKPSAPVYIVDLIRQLQMDDKPEVATLALKTAPSLIRRKANFGSELSDNIHALLSALININEGMSKQELERARLNALIACLVGKPELSSPWITSMYFEGDFSIVQRATLLTTIGLGAREMTGYDDLSESDVNAFGFASKRLPPHLAAVYTPLDSVARRIEHSTLQPMALAAADKVSGPNILKVRTFSSRMEVQKKNIQKAKERSKRIPKDLHKLLSESLYLPLCCRMSLLLSSQINISRSTVFEPHIMRLLFQTLTIILASAGAHTLQLSSVTRETLILLTAVHTIPKLALDPVILPAVLQLLLTTLDLNVDAGSTAEERLVTDFGSTLAELIKWAGDLNEVVSVPVATGEGVEGMPWPVLVAGIQVKWHEIGKKFQGRMLGLMEGDMEEF